MTADRATAEQWTEGVRGLMLGLALGESVGRGHQHAPDMLLRAGVATQLAAFTVEGFIRASQRMSHRGICSPPSVIWHAYRRWASGQQLGVRTPADEEVFADSPDGWLKEVPALWQRRGSSPTTVAALRAGIQGTPERPVSQSMGCQGLVRVLPLALLAFQCRRDEAVALARETSALTHGSPVGLDITSAGITVAAHCLTNSDAMDALHEGANATHELGLPLAVSNGYVEVVGADYGQGSLSRLRELAPNKTARSALLGGMYVASTYPHPQQFREALEFAALAPDGDSVGAVTGALLGASHGASQLPVDFVSRHELAWVLDTLARDAVLELTDSPDDGDDQPARDPHWWTRYPGW